MKFFSMPDHQRYEIILKENRSWVLKIHIADKDLDLDC